MLSSPYLGHLLLSLTLSLSLCAQDDGYHDLGSSRFSEKDKSFALTGKTYEKGTWFGIMKVKNLSVWEEWVKTGRVKGYSVEGFFSDKLEQYHTEENITDHGYENVRGGTYTNSKTLHKTRNGDGQLSKSEDRERIKLRKKKSLTREEHNRLEELKCCNRHANGKDYTIKKYNEVREDDLELIWTDELMTAGMSGDEEMFCATCGRNGHNYQSCYAKIDFEGNRITH